jgi:hypothetical protein
MLPNSTRTKPYRESVQLVLSYGEFNVSLDGTPAAILIALGTILVWVITGPVFRLQ